MTEIFSEETHSRYTPTPFRISPKQSLPWSRILVYPIQDFGRGIVEKTHMISGNTYLVGDRANTLRLDLLTLRRLVKTLGRLGSCVGFPKAETDVLGEVKLREDVGRGDLG